MNTLEIAGKTELSRLMIGSGKFSSSQIMSESVQASGASIVTVALRRVDLKRPEDDCLRYLDPNVTLMINTSGARDAEEACRIARLSKVSGTSNWIKLEITPEPNYLFPDPIETLKAAEILVKEGFVVLPYIHADPILAKRLEACGVASVMPLGAAIGSNQGLQTKAMLAVIIEQATVPVVVDAGIGAPSHAAEAMEMGADAVLVNTAIATAGDPVAMAKAFQQSVLAGRAAYEAGLPGSQPVAKASSPLTDFLHV